MILLAAVRSVDFSGLPQPAPWTFTRPSADDALVCATKAEAIMLDLTNGADATPVVRFAQRHRALILALVDGETERLIGRAILADASDVVAAPVSEAKLALRPGAVLRMKAEGDRARAIEEIKLGSSSLRPCRTGLIANRSAFVAAMRN